VHVKPYPKAIPRSPGTLPARAGKSRVAWLDKKGKVILYRHGHRESSPYGFLSEKILWKNPAEGSSYG